MVGGGLIFLALILYVISTDWLAYLRERDLQRNKRNSPTSHDC